jgi:hypothetical protein
VHTENPRAGGVMMLEGQLAKDRKFETHLSIIFPTSVAGTCSLKFTCSEAQAQCTCTCMSASLARAHVYAHVLSR